MPTLIYITTPNNPGVPLAEQDGPIIFEVDNGISYMTVSYPGSPFAEEVVFRDNDFQGLFKPLSTRVGKRFTVERVGSFPAPPLSHIEETGGSAPVAAVASNLYGADAIWSLFNVPASVPPSIDSTDLTGNLHSIDGVNSFDASPSLVPNRAALSTLNNSGPGCNSLPMHLGACSFYTVFRCSPLPTGLDNWVFAFGNYAAAAPGGNMSFSLLVGSSGNNKIRYYAAYSASRTTILYDFSTLAYPTDGLWHFLCGMRNTAGTIVTVGLDGVFETSTALTPPDGGSSGIATIGRAAGSSASRFNGNLWGMGWIPSERSQAEMEVIRKVQMGIA